MPLIERVQRKAKAHGSLTNQDVQDANSAVKPGNCEVRQDPVKIAWARPDDSVRGKKSKQAVDLAPISTAFQQLERRQTAEQYRRIPKGVKPGCRGGIPAQEVD